MRIYKIDVYKSNGKIKSGDLYEFETYEQAVRQAKKDARFLSCKKYEITDLGVGRLRTVKKRI